MIARSFGSVLALLALSACSASLDTSLDNKRCTRTHRCVSGYTCSDTGFCVRSIDASTPPDSGPSDGGEDSGTTSVVDASSATPVLDASSGERNATGDAPVTAEPESPITTAPQSHSDAGPATPSGRESPSGDAEPPPPPGDAEPPPPRGDPKRPRPGESPPPPPKGPKGEPRDPSEPSRALHGPDAMQACPPNRTRCGSACVDLEHEASTCGACTVACKVDETCRAGMCVAETPVGSD